MVSMEDNNNNGGGVGLQIVVEQPPNNDKLALDSWGSTMFEPQREALDPAEEGNSPSPAAGPSSSTCEPNQFAPEKKLTLFALRLSILEKVASSLGTLGFIWATVVLLGGFAIALKRIDFWFVTVILLIEGARIFSRSHELEWQHQATWSIAEAGRNSFRAIRLSYHAIKLIFRPFSIAQRGNSLRVTADIQRSERSQRVDASARRTWHTPDVPFLPVGSWLFLSRNISRILYWLQLLSASACVSLSLIRLAEQNYGSSRRGNEDRLNLASSLNIFYGLALSEALMFLAEKAYWEWKVSHRRLLEEVNKECDLGPTGMISVRRFFYDSYSKCINGSIFDGLKMDLVSFGQELLDSDSQDEQLIGARILLRFATHRRFSDDTLRKIGTNAATMERLIEMLNWKNPAEEEIRHSAARIVSKLAGKKQNALRVAGIPGAMESISSLLYTHSRRYFARPDEVVIHHECSELNLMGLLILKKLCHDHDNCGKIGNTRGLLATIVEFTGADEKLLQSSGEEKNHRIMAVKRSLQLLKLLSCTTGHTGKVLRKEISEIVFTVSNIREVLRHGEQQPSLQKLAVEVLTSLAMDEEARERIGGTGAVVKELLRIFFANKHGDEYLSVSAEAGEALAMLALESENNCRRILKEDDVVLRLVGGLKDPAIRVNSSRILHNLCAFVETSTACNKLQAVTGAFSTVLKAVMVEQMKLLEVSLGLATQILRFTNPEDLSCQLQIAGIPVDRFVVKLVMILRTYNYPSIKVPRIRRFAIGLAISVMKTDRKFIQLFEHYGMKQELEHVIVTTTELEGFNVFCGSVGLSRDNATISSLISEAIELINQA